MQLKKLGAHICTPHVPHAVETGDDYYCRWNVFKGVVVNSIFNSGAGN